MSWGSAGNAIGGAFKQGLKSEMATGAMRNANDPTGAGYGTPRPAPAPTAQQATPAAEPIAVGAQQQPAAPAPAEQLTPLMALMHAIWSRPAPPMR